MNVRRPSGAAAFFAALLSGLALAFVPAVHAQGVVSAGVTGLITDSGGKPVAGATVQAIHTPTNTAYTATSGSTGRYRFRSLIVGGPYTFTVTAPGFKPAEQTDIVTQLGADIDVNLGLQPGEVLALDKFVVTAETSRLDSAAAGAGSVMTNSRLLAQPTAKRSIGDMARTNPLVTFRQAITDRDDQMITAVGQNNRYNSILLDGARINDQFGLNASGIQSFFNPISLDTVEQFSIAISPYDVRQSGFTGAASNAVTKSGTNRFPGSAYTFCTGANYAGENITGTSIANGVLFVGTEQFRHGNVI